MGEWQEEEDNKLKHAAQSTQVAIIGVQLSRCSGHENSVEKMALYL
jgi:hypothetical protein